MKLTKQEAMHESETIMRNALSAVSELLNLENRDPQDMVNISVRLADGLIHLARDIAGSRVQAPIAPKPESPNPVTTSGALTVSRIVEEYERDYELNPVAAKRKYQDKRVTLKGIVEEIAEANYGFRVIITDCVCCFPPEREDDVLELRKGESVFITGTWYYDGHAELRDCELVGRVRHIPVVPAASVYPVQFLVKEYKVDDKSARERYEGKRLKVLDKICDGDFFWSAQKVHIYFRRPLESHYELENTKLKGKQKFAVIGTWHYEDKKKGGYMSDCELVIVQK